MSRFSANYQICGQFEIEHNLLSPSSTSTFSQSQLPSPSAPSPPSAEHHHQSHHFKTPKIIITIIFTLLIVFTIVTVAKFHHHTLNGVKDNYGIIGNQMALESGPSRESVVVDTDCERLIGDEEYGSYVFKGIPYALPPIGPRRWSPPIAVWNDPNHCHPNDNARQRHATKFGSQCFQVNPYNGQYEGREDCLYLNIWTPDIDHKANLPVMVWIHGGFLQFGSGHQPGLRPSGRLSSVMKTVFVSVNYRLHVLGFLSMDALNAQKNGDNFTITDESPNFGIQDLIVSLQWIQRNIHSFGGDSRRVTLFGPDGGAALILALMSAPSSQNLFHSSWLIDPSVFFNRTVAEASRHNSKNFLKRTQCANVTCLRSLSPQKIVEHFLGKNDPSFRINDQNDLPILGIMSEQLITIDDTLIFDFFPFSSSSFSDIPLLIGSSVEAIDFWPGPRDLFTWTWRDYRKYVTTSLDSFGPQISEKSLELYPPIEDPENVTTPATQYVTMVSDLRQLCPINYLAEQIANQLSSDVYRYLLKSKPSKPIKVYDTFSDHSFHLWDIIAFFDTIDTYMKVVADDDRNLTHTMQTMVKTFIDIASNNSHNNFENSSFLWHSIPLEIATIDGKIHHEKYYRSERCQFWQNETFLNYAWTV